KGNETDLRTLIKAKLFDVSPVTFPAYADTDIALRSFEAWEEKQALKEAEAEARKKEAEQQKENKYKPDIEHYKRRLRIAEI
nr:hypothetical protein [Fodinibius sp.]NIV09868.1 hypothetical protein [Fodinibius sp.]NIY23407.1 hypothetical protein [Fodinibius sp.]